MHFFQTVVRVWFRVLGKDSSPHRKLTFLYLANDVVQNSKKKFPEYAKEFGTVIKKVIEHLAGITMDEKVVKSIGRLLNIWKERTIFDGKIQNEMSRIWATKALEVKAASGTDTEKAAGSIKRKSSGEPQNLFSVRVEVKVLIKKTFLQPSPLRQNRRRNPLESTPPPPRHPPKPPLAPSSTPAGRLIPQQKTTTPAASTIATKTTTAAPMAKICFSHFSAPTTTPPLLLRQMQLVLETLQILKNSSRLCRSVHLQHFTWHGLACTTKL